MLQRVELGSFRDALDLPGRLEQALLLKDEANLQFAEGRWRVAMVGYLTGLWLLRGGGAACRRAGVASRPRSAAASRRPAKRAWRGRRRLFGLSACRRFVQEISSGQEIRHSCP